MKLNYLSIYLIFNIFRGTATHLKAKKKSGPSSTMQDPGAKKKKKWIVYAEMNKSVSRSEQYYPLCENCWNIFD